MFEGVLVGGQEWHRSKLAGLVCVIKGGGKMIVKRPALISAETHHNQRRWL